jgi:hypothetical protein
MLTHEGGLSLLLALEIASTGRSATDRDGAARTDPADEHREPALGCAPHPRRLLKLGFAAVDRSSSSRKPAFAVDVSAAGSANLRSIWASFSGKRVSSEISCCPYTSKLPRTNAGLTLGKSSPLWSRTRALPAWSKIRTVDDDLPISDDFQSRRFDARYFRSTPINGQARLVRFVPDSEVCSELSFF